MIQEKTIEIEGIEPVIIFGPHDTHIKKIRAEFPDVSIMARGNTLLLKGKQEELQVLQQLLGEMVNLAQQHGEVLDNDVSTLLSLAFTPVSSGTPAQSANNDIIVTTKDYAVRAKTNGQRKMVAEARHNDILFAIGPAGTGKTYTAVAIAVAAWKAKQVKRIVLARPAVEAGESLGFLPGDLAQKIDPYLRPVSYTHLTLPTN